MQSNEIINELQLWIHDLKEISKKVPNTDFYEGINYMLQLIEIKIDSMVNRTSIK